MRIVGFCWVAVVCISTLTDAFQIKLTGLNHAVISGKYKLSPPSMRKKPAVYDILMGKGFGSATDKKKPVTDAMSKANNPAIPPVPIAKHELPPGSQFMGQFILGHSIIPCPHDLFAFTVRNLVSVLRTTIIYLTFVDLAF